MQRIEHFNQEGERTSSEPWSWEILDPPHFQMSTFDHRTFVAVGVPEKWYPRLLSRSKYVYGFRVLTRGRLAIELDGPWIMYNGLTNGYRRLGHAGPAYYRTSDDALIAYEIAPDGLRFRFPEGTQGFGGGQKKYEHWTLLEEDELLLIHYKDSLVVWDLRTKQCLDELPFRTMGGGRELCMGRRFLVGMGTILMDKGETLQRWVWDLEKHEFCLKDDVDEAFASAYEPSSERLFLGGRNDLRAYDLVHGKLLWCSPFEGTEVTTVTNFSEHGRLVVGDNRRLLHVLDTETGRPLERPIYTDGDVWHGRAIGSRMLATGGVDYKVLVLDVVAWEPRAALYSVLSRVQELAYCPVTKSILFRDRGGRLVRWKWAD